MRTARFTLVVIAYTDDHDRALAEARAFIDLCGDSWYAPVRLDSAIEVSEPESDTDD